MKKRLLSIICAVSVCLFLLTASIGLPIYIRPFYYAHIEWYDLEAVSGYSEAEHHFADCRVLFELNAVILVSSACVLLLLFVMRKKWGPYRIGRRSAPFWAAVLSVTAPIIIGGLAALDFDRAFVIFHSILFPGKTNWLFNWYEDQIIRVLPQEFFRNCAILIGAGLVAMAGGILVWEFRRNKKEQA